MEFKTVEELYNRIEPALYSKVMEFTRNGLTFVKEEDIWNYLSEYTWVKSENLTLADMVNSIMDLKASEIKDYCLDILKSQDRRIIENTKKSDSIGDEGVLL